MSWFGLWRVLRKDCSAHSFWLHDVWGSPCLRRVILRSGHSFKVVVPPSTAAREVISTIDYLLKLLKMMLGGGVQHEGGRGAAARVSCLLPSGLVTRRTWVLSKVWRDSCPL